MVPGRSSLMVKTSTSGEVSSLSHIALKLDINLFSGDKSSSKTLCQEPLARSSEM